MHNPFKAISISLIPNFNATDIKDCFNLKTGQISCQGSKQGLEQFLKKQFKKDVDITENGRLALYLLLKAWGIQSGDEVILQAFTCSVDPAAIMAIGAKPIYVDIDSSYNLNPADLKAKITKKTKAVIIQHTFATPANIKKIISLCRHHHLKLIEDLAHGIGVSYQKKLLGQWGDAAILSFGRDKAVSGIWGGAVVADDKTIKKIKNTQKNWPLRSQKWVRTQLAYPIWIWLILQTYGLGLGKMIHWFYKKSKKFSGPISSKEKKGRLPPFFQGLPDELSWLVLKQLKKLPQMIKTRKSHAKIYSQTLGLKHDPKSAYLRYSIEVDHPKHLRSLLTQKSIFLGDWYDQVIAPKSINLKKFSYLPGSCPKAETASSKIVNLPTNPNINAFNVLKIASIINQWK